MKEIVFAGYSIALIISAVCIILVCMQKASKDQKMMQIVSFLIGLLILGHWFRIQACSIEGLVFAQKLIYLAGCHLWYFMLLFISDYCSIHIAAWARKTMVVFNCFMTVVALTFDRHSLLYSSYHMETHQGLPIMVKEYGPLHTVFCMSMIFYSTLMAVIALRNICGHGRKRGKQTFGILLVVLLPLAAYFIDRVCKLSFELAPLGAAAGELVMLYLMYVVKLYDVNDIARDFAVESQEDALVVLDGKYRYKGSNQLAKQLFSELRDAILDKSIEQISDKLWETVNDEKQDVTLGERIYELHIRELDHRVGERGIVLCFSDVTSHRQHLELLQNYQKNLELEVDRKTVDLQKAQERLEQSLLQTIRALSSTVEAKDRYTNGHSKRVAEYAREIARRMGKSEQEQTEIYYAGLLHDVGKIRVSDAIINKKGKLTDDELASVKLHPVVGYHILRGISDMHDIASGARWHHERYDGNGYPDGLAGENIPQIARIIGVVDAYDAMTSNRSYRHLLPQEVVRSEFEEGMGKQFDPGVTKIMLEMIDEDTAYTMKQDTSIQKNILIIDDDEIYLELAENTLQKEMQYRLYKAHSGREGMDIFLEQDIDLVLLDIEMPGIDGIEALKWIRSCQDVPVIFMTDDKGLGMIEKANELGASDYLAKPFLPQALLEIVHNVLQQIEMT